METNAKTWKSSELTQLSYSNYVTRTWKTFFLLDFSVVHSIAAPLSESASSAHLWK